MSTFYDRTNANILVVHYLGDGQEPVPNRSELFRRANPYSYDYPEYDYGIISDGTVIPMRPLTVRGAHCISDIPSMMHSDNLWWNKNSISIVIGVGDGYVATDAQLKSLSSFIKDWESKSGNIVYRHCNITKTDCPNLSEDIWNNVLKGFDDFSMDVCVVYFTPSDYSMALIYANMNGNSAMFCRNGQASVNQDVMKSKKVYTIGGPKIGHPDEIYLSGNTSADTLMLIADNLRGK